MNILGIESSCDETGVAIYHSVKGLLAHAIYSQIDLHAEYGGVVPELASRDHIRKLLPLIKQLLSEVNLNINDINAIGYTAGPGLIGALLVGAVFARTLAWALNIPCVPVHHMEAHLLAVMLEKEKPVFPFLGLLVSGGHTLLLQANAVGDYTILGESLDDAVGEAFDKTAKLLGLSYPGGAALAALAQQGDPAVYHFPRPMLDRPGLDFSFSGLKTFALNTWNHSDKSEQTKKNIACAFQEAVVETLIKKCQRALNQTGLSQLVVAGGVGANQKLRESLIDLMKKINGHVYYPRPLFCTDNGAMVAYAAYQRLQLKKIDNDLVIRAFPRWEMGKLKEK